jgi:hypothetical protein
MMFLTLEMTGAFALIPLLVPSVLLSALTARRQFGLSFATCVFHLRGELRVNIHLHGFSSAAIFLLSSARRFRYSGSSAGPI